MSLSNQIIYFVLGDYNTKTEFGHYLIEDSSISEGDKNYIVSHSMDKIKTFSEKDINSKDYMILDNNHYCLFYFITASGIFYLSISSIQSIYMDKNNLMYELFEDIENQNLKKFVDPETGNLNKVGLQNLKFSIDQHNIKMKGQNIEGNKDNNNINMSNSQINDINIETKDNVKNVSVNLNEVEILNNTNSNIRNSSQIPQYTSFDFERRMRRNFYVKIGLGFFIMVGIYIAIKMIFI